jgi:hypothetical protein
MVKKFELLRQKMDDAAKAPNRGLGVLMMRGYLASNSWSFGVRKN